MATNKNKKNILSEDAFNCIMCDITFHKNFMSTEIQICKACKLGEKKMINGSKVFVVNYNDKDMKDAKQYGVLIPITEGNVNVFDIERLTLTIEEILEKYNFDGKKDYLLLCGGQPINFTLGVLVSKYNKVKLLLWDAKKRIYIKRTFKIRREATT